MSSDDRTELVPLPSSMFEYPAPEPPPENPEGTEPVPFSENSAPEANAAEPSNNNNNSSTIQVHTFEEVSLRLTALAEALSGLTTCLDVLHEDIEKLKRGGKPVQWCDKPINSTGDVQAEGGRESGFEEGLRRHEEEEGLEKGGEERTETEGREEGAGEGEGEGDDENGDGLGDMISGFVFGGDAEKRDEE